MIKKIARIYVRVFVSAVVLWLLYLFLKLMWDSSGIWGIAAVISVILLFIAIIYQEDGD